MKRASDFRRLAREGLQGRWFVSVLTAFLASLFGAGIATSGSISVSLPTFEDTSDVSLDTAVPFFEGPEDVLVFLAIFAVVFVIVMGIILVAAAAALVIGGIFKPGYACFNLNLVDGQKVSVGQLFSQPKRIGAGIVMNLLIGLYTTLWSLLFIIPGIVKSYSYAMAPYILYERPEITAKESIAESSRMMYGHRFRLFCLHLSFIGWHLLTLVPVILMLLPLIGGAWIVTLLLFLPMFLLTFVGIYLVMAYMEAASAAFYREVSGTERPRFTEKTPEVQP